MGAKTRERRLLDEVLARVEAGEGVGDVRHVEVGTHRGAEASRLLTFERAVGVRLEVRGGEWSATVTFGNLPPNVPAEIEAGPFPDRAAALDMAVSWLAHLRASRQIGPANPASWPTEGRPTTFTYRGNALPVTHTMMWDRRIGDARIGVVDTLEEVDEALGASGDDVVPRLEGEMARAMVAIAVMAVRVGIASWPPPARSTAN